MSNDAILSYSTKGLEQILKAVKGRPLKGKVGILHDSARRGRGSQTNAGVGAAHEFGTSTLPVRSFLRMPVQGYLMKEAERSRLFTDKAIKEVIKQGTLRPWLEKLNECALKVIDKAFATEGFGTWAPWTKPHDHGSILVDTSQLRHSIEAEVK